MTYFYYYCYCYLTISSNIKLLYNYKQMKNEDLKILQSNPEFLNDENEELKKAKKVLEANESENPTPIDEYSEQLLKADQTLKEDCIKPVDISKNKAIKFGSYLIKMWFASPYPAEYSERPILYLCENCFKYLNSEYALIRHQVNIYYFIKYCSKN